MNYSFIDVLYPKQCVCCGEIIDDSEELCDNCIRNIERVDDTKRCMKCGLIKGDCGCKIYTYHFEGVVAPFFNQGLAKRGIYGLKFNRRTHLSRFFANEMSKTVRSQLNNMEFDAVCYVPSSFRSYLKRGFNQSYLLAERISSLLSIPLLKRSIKCRLMSGVQHKLNREKRFEASQKKYCFSENMASELKDKRILLVDDIKTTGATLDECSRQLLLGGGKSVFCVTALVTDMKQLKEKRK